MPKNFFNNLFLYVKNKKTVTHGIEIRIKTDFFAYRKICILKIVML